MFEAVFEMMDAEERALVSERLAVFSEDRPDRTQLFTAANHPAIFALEKKYVPRLNAGRSSEIACDTLISTVGMRLPPVVLTVLCLRPKRLFLLHTQASRRIAEQVRDDPDVCALGLHPDVETTLKSISEVDAPHNYDMLQTDILPAAHGQVVVDPTGGLKIMGISVAAMAFWQRLPMVYLLGTEVQGIVVPFSEKLSWVKNPYDHFGDPDLELMVRLFDRGEYDAALKVCIQLRETVNDIRRESWLHCQEELIGLYRDWDAFRHSVDNDQVDRRLGTRLAEIAEKARRLNIHLVDRDLDENVRFLQQIESTWREGKNLVEPYRMVDVFINAERKGRAGLYDDAVARLYRCLEMCSTYILVEHWRIGSSSKPDIRPKLAAHFGGESELAARYLETFSRALPLGGAPWALDDQMKVLQLAEPENRIPHIYDRMARSGPGGNESLMGLRNRSILAHGTSPVQEADYQAFHAKTLAILRETLTPKIFNAIYAAGQHPRLAK